MATSEHINDYFNGRPFMVLCVLALMAMTAVALAMGVQPAAIESRGAFFSLQGTLVKAGPMSAATNLLCLMAAGGIMLALNKVYGYIRSMTHLYVSAFLLLQLANPSGLVALGAGTLVCLVTALLAMPLFASFQDRHSQRHIFLVFAVVAAGSMFHYGALVLLPAFLLGFLNMGVFNLKGLLAMLFGLITPFWIVLGLGIVAPTDFNAPHFNGIWNLAALPQFTHELVLAALTAVVGVVLAVMNLMTIMNYRMQTRVYNVFFVFVLVLAVIALCIDYSDIAVYLPLLSLMVAVQVAQAHNLRSTHSRRYISMLLFIAGCFALGITSMLLP